MTIEHKDISDPNIHEVKGITSATANYILIADGTGSGSWKGYMGGNNGSISLGDSADNSDATTISVADTYYNLAGTWVEELVVGTVTTSVASGKILPGINGTHLISAEITATSAATNTSFSFVVLVNGVKAGPRIRREVGTTPGALSLSAVVTTTDVTDYIQIGVTIKTGDGTPPENITVTNAIINCILLKET